MTYPPHQGTPHGQPQYGYPYEQQYGGFHYPGGAGGPQPPKNSKIGVWISVIIGVLVIVVFLVTGLVAPGFLLGDDDNDSAGFAKAPTSESAVPRPERSTVESSRAARPGDGRSQGAFPPSSSHDEVAHFDSVDELFEKFIAALNENDAGAATSMLCPDVSGSTHDATTQITGAESDLRVDEVKDHGRAWLEGTVDGEGAGVSLTAYKTADSLCIKYVTGPTAQPLHTSGN